MMEVCQFCGEYATQCGDQCRILRLEESLSAAESRAKELESELAEARRVIAEYRKLECDHSKINYCHECKRNREDAAAAFLARGK